MQRTPILWLLPIVITVSACESGTSTGPAPLSFAAPPAPPGQGFVAQYAPPVDIGPYPNDIYNLPGQVLSVPDKVTSPLAQALNTLDGFSTTAKITAPFNATLDQTTLIPFDPTAPTGTETVFVLNASLGMPMRPGVDYALQVSTTLGTNGSVLEIVPLLPLSPATTYVFILTDGIQSAAGVAAGADTVFGLVRDAHLASVTTGNPGLDALLPAIGPVVDAGVNLLGLSGASIVSGWSVSTQSTTDVLDWIDSNATGQASVLAPMGITTADLGLLGAADIYAGYIEVPYYGDPTDPLGSFWVNAGLMPLTRSDPVPIAQGGILRIPLLATLPNAGSGQMRPAGGWPVAFSIHGVTVNRTATLPLADALAQGGFALVAIDLPLHGVTDVTSPFYQGPGSPFGNNERHFNLDNVGPVGDLQPDGQIDDGWQIFNVGNPLNARDHGRQVFSDLTQLVRSLPTMDFDGDMAGDLDASQAHFISLSLGSIFSMAFVAINDDFSTVTMSSPGGPFSEFLFDPMATAFGLPIRTGIEAQGLAFGTTGFDNFARDLQTLVDPIDPFNYAIAAAANHPIHVIEVLSDTAVTANLTDNLATIMGLTDVSQTLVDPGGARGIVRFTTGGHSSFFNPSIDLATTVEMQTQAVTFAATGGTTILITDDTVVQ